MKTCYRLMSTATALVALTLTPVRGAVIYTEDFNSYSGNQNNTQFETGLEVAFGGTVTGWDRAGSGVIHAVDLNNLGGQSNPSDWAVMIWQDNVITMNSGIAANDAGLLYAATFNYGTAVYAGGSQATGATDFLLVEVLRADNSVLNSGSYAPGAWSNPGNANLSAGQQGTLIYLGDGTGDVRIRVSPGNIGQGRFQGSFDNLAVATVNPAALPEPGTVAFLGVGLAILGGTRRRKALED